MLQVTGHAGGVPIASPRGRSVEVPFEREPLLLTVNCALFRQICQGVFDVFLKKDTDLLVFNIQLCFVRLSVAQY